MAGSARFACVVAAVLVLCFGGAARTSASEPTPAPAPSSVPAVPLDMSPVDLEGNTAVLRPQPLPLPVPRRAHGLFSLTEARYRNDGSVATALDLQRYLGPADDRRVRAYVNAAYGRETYTTLISTSAPLPPPPKTKPKKPLPTPPPIITPFVAADVSLSTAVGLEFRASRSVRFFAQGGPGNQRDDNGDLRAGFVTRVGTEWYQPWEPRGPGAAYGYVDVALNAAGGPFANAALIVDAQRVHPLGRSERSPELTLRVSTAADTRRRYFSNVAEAAIGIRIAPFRGTGPSFGLEAVAGRFGVGAAMPHGMRRGYGALRPSISQSLPL
jgi:hypothetical protein